MEDEAVSYVALLPCGSAGVDARASTAAHPPSFIVLVHFQLHLTRLLAHDCNRYIFSLFHAVECSGLVPLGNHASLERLARQVSHDLMQSSGSIQLSISSEAKSHRQYRNHLVYLSSIESSMREIRYSCISFCSVEGCDGQRTGTIKSESHSLLGR